MNAKCKIGIAFQGCCLTWVLVVIMMSGIHAADWPMGRGNPQGTGATSDTLPPDLDLLWEVRLDGIGFDAGPIIADGKVYVNDHEGRILALDLRTGDELWRQELDTGFVATPAYRDGLLFVGDYDGVLRALAADTGEERWRFETQLQIDSSPNFYKSTVLVTSQDGTLYGLNFKDGKQLWKYETGDQLQCGASLAGHRTFLGGCDAHLHVIDVTSGQALGSPVAIDGPTGSTPSVFDNSVLVPTFAGEVFSFAMPAEAQQPLAEPSWRFRDPKLADEVKNSLAVAQGLAVMTSRKRVFAIEVESGKQRWNQVLRKRADASPVIAGDSVIVAAADGRILRYDLQTGEEQWMTEVKGAFLGSPAVSDGKLVLTNDRGSIFCFGGKQ